MFGASVSPDRITYSEWWVGYIIYELNAVMNYEMECPKIQKSKRLENLNIIKKINATDKHPGINEDLPG